MMHAQFKWTGPIHAVEALLWNSNDLQSDIWWLLYDEATTTGKCEMEWQTNWTQLQLVWFLQGIPTKYAKVHQTEFLPIGMQNCLRFKSLSILYWGPWNKNGIPEHPITQTNLWKTEEQKRFKRANFHDLIFFLYSPRVVSWILKLPDKNRSWNLLLKFPPFCGKTRDNPCSYKRSGIDAQHSVFTQ